MNIEKMKSMESMRRELVANVSHDLRTPLTVIHGYVETLMMKEQSLDAKDKGKYLETILGSTEKLKKLVDDLFELSKLEAKQVRPTIEPFHISDLIGELANKYELIAVTKNIKIESNVGDDVTTVNADVRLIERVLQNLIDNALKFTLDGGTIKIEANQRAQHVEVVVSDTGLGIPEDQIPFIFDRYRKVDKVQPENDKTGSGLGLAIVKKILEIHNASIELKSRINQGTTFSFQLPQYQN